MRRRSYLRLATASVVGLAGCTAIAGPEPDDPDGTPTGACPELLGGDRTVCPHRDAGPLTVDRRGGTISSDRWSLAVAVTNRSESGYRFAPDDWTIFRRIDDRWATAVPDTGIPERHVALEPGDRYVWGLTAGGPVTADVDRRVTVDLDPGRYGLAVPFSGPDRVVVVAGFSVD